MYPLFLGRAPVFQQPMPSFVITYIRILFVNSIIEISYQVNLMALSCYIDDWRRAVRFIQIFPEQDVKTVRWENSVLALESVQNFLRTYYNTEFLSNLAAWFSRDRNSEIYLVCHLSLLLHTRLTTHCVVGTTKHDMEEESGSGSYPNLRDQLCDSCGQSKWLG